MPSITHNEPFFFFLPPSRGAHPPVALALSNGDAAGGLGFRRRRPSSAAHPTSPAPPNLLRPPPPPVWSGPEHVAPPRPRWYVPHIDAGAPHWRARPVRPSLLVLHHRSSPSRRARPVRSSLLVLHHRSSPSRAATPRPHVASGQARTQGARRPHHRSPWCSTGRARPSLLSATSSSSIYDSSDQICKAGTKISPLSLLLCDRCISNVQN
jgi:hypothetical protein